MKLIVFGVVAIAGVVWCVSAAARRAEAVQPAPGGQDAVAVEAKWNENHLYFQEAQECKECHSGPNDARARKGAFDITLQTEYSVWKTHDKHAQAYAVLIGDRGKKIGKLLGDKDVTKAEAGCLSCHAMHNLNEFNAEVAKKSGEKISPLGVEDGVSCGACHGPSGSHQKDKDKKLVPGWVTTHVDAASWRNGLNAQQKSDRGMRDLHDPVVRSQVCMSCHIGNAAEGKVVTHAMMAAGHPPLPPIEISTFSQNEPQHWRDFKDTPALQGKTDKEKELNKFARTRFALIGNVVAVRETLKLARDRTNFAHAKSQLVFPEVTGGGAKAHWPQIAMAHSDCFACHHDLTYPGFRQKRGFGYSVPGVADALVTPGRPIIRSWPLGVLKVGLDAVDNKPPELKEALPEKLKNLATATSSQPFGDPAAIARETDALIKWCDQLIAELVKPETEFNRARCITVLKSLSTLYDGDVNKNAIPDYESARQVASMALIAAEDLGMKGEQEGKVMGDLNKSLNLKPYLLHREDRVAVLLGVIREAAKKARVLPDGDEKRFDTDAEKFGAYLKKNVGDTDVLKTMYLNFFLNVVQQGVPNDKFTEALTKRDIADKLQGYGDKEQELALKAVSEYKPEEFRANMKKLANLIPAN